MCMFMQNTHMYENTHILVHMHMYSNSTHIHIHTPMHIAIQSSQWSVTFYVRQFLEKCVVYVEVAFHILLNPSSQQFFQAVEHRWVEVSIKFVCKKLIGWCECGKITNAKHAYLTNIPALKNDMIQLETRHMEDTNYFLQRWDLHRNFTGGDRGKGWVKFLCNSDWVWCDL